jgi:hypothetical protein
MLTWSIITAAREDKKKKKNERFCPQVGVRASCGYGYAATASHGKQESGSVAARIEKMGGTGLSETTLADDGAHRKSPAVLAEIPHL